MDILKPGVSYDFRVIAVNDYGFGTPSSPSQSVAGTTYSVRGGGSGEGAREERQQPQRHWSGDPEGIVLSVLRSQDPWAGARVSLQLRKELGGRGLGSSFPRTPEALGSGPSGLEDESVGPRW